MFIKFALIILSLCVMPLYAASSAQRQRSALIQAQQSVQNIEEKGKIAEELCLCAIKYLETDEIRAQQFLIKAAELGDHSALILLGIPYTTGPNDQTITEHPISYYYPY